MRSKKVAGLANLLRQGPRQVRDYRNVAMASTDTELAAEA